MRVLFALVLLFGGAGCGSPEGPRDASLGSPFDVAMGETVAVAGEDLHVTFESVTEDSRCPEGAQCVWEGDAVARVTLVKSPEKSVTVDLHTNGRFDREAEYHGYVVGLVDIAPHPRTDKPRDPKAYVATLRVDHSS